MGQGFQVSSEWKSRELVKHQTKYHEFLKDLGLCFASQRFSSKRQFSGRPRCAAHQDAKKQLEEAGAKAEIE